MHEKPYSYSYPYSENLKKLYSLTNENVERTGKRGAGKKKVGGLKVKVKTP